MDDAEAWNRCIAVNRAGVRCLSTARTDGPHCPIHAVDLDQGAPSPAATRTWQVPATRP